MESQIILKILFLVYWLLLWLLCFSILVLNLLLLDDRQKSFQKPWKVSYMSLYEFLLSRLHGLRFDSYQVLLSINSPMLKKSSLVFFLILIFTPLSSTFWCDFNNGDIRSSLDNCFLETQVVSPPEDLEVINGGGFNTFLLLWVNAIAWVLGVAAVWAIAYGSLMLTLSMWEDEKITKAKDTIKWWILGFIAIIVANALIELLINVLYDI